MTDFSKRAAASNEEKGGNKTTPTKSRAARYIRDRSLSFFFLSFSSCFSLRSP